MLVFIANTLVSPASYAAISLADLNAAPGGKFGGKLNASIYMTMLIAKETLYSTC